MHNRIFKGIGPMYEMGEPVRINNKVRMPNEEEEEPQEDEISEEERLRIEKEEKAAEEKRFNDAVNAEIEKFMTNHKAAFERERDAVIAQAKKQAADMAADAKAATMSVLQKAEQECAVIKEQARKEGHDEGFAEGRKESIEKYEKYIDAAGKLLAEINSRKDAYYIANEDELRQTAFELTEKITMTELKTDPKILDGIIAEAAKNFRNSDYVKITLAEDEITERFKTDAKLINEIIPFIPEIEISFDSEAETGTVVIDNGSSIVDAGVPTQLEFLREIMKNTRGANSDDAEDNEQEQ